MSGDDKNIYVTCPLRHFSPEVRNESLQCKTGFFFSSSVSLCLCVYICVYMYVYVYVWAFRHASPVQTYLKNKQFQVDVGWVGGGRGQAAVSQRGESPPPGSH